MDYEEREEQSQITDGDEPVAAGILPEDRGDLLVEISGAEPGDGAPIEQPASSDDVSADGGGGRSEEPPSMIPRARLNEVLRQREEAEERAARLEAELAQLRQPAGAASNQAPAVADPAPEFDFDAKEAAAMEAMLSGDMDSYRALRREIRAAERALFEREAEAKAAGIVESRQRAAEMEVEKQVFAQVAADAVNAYPFLDAKDGDSQAIEDVIEWRDFFIAKGVRPAQALADAVNKVGPMHAARLGAGTGKGAAAGSEDVRKARAIERNVAAQNAQAPVPMAGIGERAQGGRVSVEKLSDEQFKSLPEDEKRRLRGD